MGSLIPLQGKVQVSKAFGEGNKYLKPKWRFFFAYKNRKYGGITWVPYEQTSTEDPATGVKEMVPQVSRVTEFVRGVPSRGLLSPEGASGTGQGWHFSEWICKAVLKT